MAIVSVLFFVKTIKDIPQAGGWVCGVGGAVAYAGRHSVFEKSRIVDCRGAGAVCGAKP